MKTKLICVIVIFLFSALQMVGAKPKVLLRLNLEKGENYEMTMVMDNNMDQDVMGQKMKILQKMEMVTSYKVLDVLPDKNYVLEYSFKRMKLNMDANGNQSVIDSEGSPDNPVIKAIKDMMDLKLKVTLNSLGKVQKVEGMEEYAGKLAGNPQLAQSMHMFSDENKFKAFFEQCYGFYPETEVETGTKWTQLVKMPDYMNMDLEMNYEVSGIEDEQVLLNVFSNINTDAPIEYGGTKMHLKMTGSQNGVMKIDRKGGLESSSDLTQKTDMLMKMNNPQSGEEMEIPMKMNSVIKISVVKI